MKSLGLVCLAIIAMVALLGGGFIYLKTRPLIMKGSPAPTVAFTVGSDATPITHTSSGNTPSFSENRETISSLDSTAHAQGSIALLASNDSEKPTTVAPSTSRNAPILTTQSNPASAIPTTGTPLPDGPPPGMPPGPPPDDDMGPPPGPPPGGSGGPGFPPPPPF